MHVRSDGSTVRLHDAHLDTPLSHLDPAELKLFAEHCQAHMMSREEVYPFIFALGFTAGDISLLGDTNSVVAAFQELTRSAASCATIVYAVLSLQCSMLLADHLPQLKQTTLRDLPQHSRFVPITHERALAHVW